MSRISIILSLSLIHIYPFIKETIKERPADRKMLLHKFLTAAVCGVIFGGCAAGTAALILPEVAQSLRKHSEQYTDVTLVPSVTAASCVDEAEDENTSTALAKMCIRDRNRL